MDENVNVAQTPKEIHVILVCSMYFIPVHFLRQLKVTGTHVCRLK